MERNFTVLGSLKVKLLCFVQRKGGQIKLLCPFYRWKLRFREDIEPFEGQIAKLPEFVAAEATKQVNDSLEKSELSLYITKEIMTIMKDVVSKSRVDKD